ncbi:hypothetical protein Q1B88_004817 [Salmonella enterica]
MLAKCSPEGLVRIEEKTEKLRREVLLHQLREELSMSQTELADAMGVNRSRQDQIDPC